MISKLRALDVRMGIVESSAALFRDPDRCGDADGMEFLNAAFATARMALRTENNSILSELAVIEQGSMIQRQMVIADLTSSTELNGRRVVVESFDPSSSRYTVTYIDCQTPGRNVSKQHRVKRHNLVDPVLGGSAAPTERDGIYASACAGIARANRHEASLRWDAVPFARVCQHYDYDDDGMIDIDEFTALVSDLLVMRAARGGQGGAEPGSATQIAQEIARGMHTRESAQYVDYRQLKAGARDHGAFDAVFERLGKGQCAFELFQGLDQFYAAPTPAPPAPDFGQAGAGSAGAITIEDVKPDDPVYQDVKRRLCDTYQPARLLRISRWVHPTKRLQHDAQAQEMESRSDGVGANRKMLWHGCRDEATLEKIRLQGFNRDYSSTAAYGRGVYFARDACYSAADRYATRTHEGTEVLLLAQVLAGQSTPGHHSMKTGPPKNEHDLSGSSYDSLHSGDGNVHLDPSICVSCHNDNQAYAEFAVEYLPDLQGQHMRVTGLTKETEVNGRVVTVGGAQVGGDGEDKYVCTIEDRQAFVADQHGNVHGVQRTPGRTMLIRPRNLVRVRQ
jgi:hypothetical protein